MPDGAAGQHGAARMGCVGNDDWAWQAKDRNTNGTAASSRCINAFEIKRGLMCQLQCEQYVPP